MSLSADAYGALLAPRVGIIQDALLVERVRIVTGATKISAEDALGLRPHSEFTITVEIDNMRWYSRRGGEVVGTATGDLTLPVAGTIDRVVQQTSASLTINATGGSWATWRLGPGAQATVTIETPHGTIPLSVASDVSSIGGGFIRFAFSPAQQTIASGVATGDLVTITIAP